MNGIVREVTGVCYFLWTSFLANNKNKIHMHGYAFKMNDITVGSSGEVVHMSAHVIQITLSAEMCFELSC